MNALAALATTRRTIVGPSRERNGQGPSLVLPLPRTLAGKRTIVGPFAPAHAWRRGQRWSPAPTCDRETQRTIVGPLSPGAPPQTPVRTITHYARVPCV